MSSKSFERIKSVTADHYVLNAIHPCELRSIMKGVCFGNEITNIIFTPSDEDISIPVSKAGVHFFDKGYFIHTVVTLRSSELIVSGSCLWYFFRKEAASAHCDGVSVPRERRASCSFPAMSE